MRSDTANHTINAFKNRVNMPGFDEIFLWEFLSDPDAWFICADPVDTELRWYGPREVQRETRNTLRLAFDQDGRFSKIFVRLFQLLSGCTARREPDGSIGAPLVFCSMARQVEEVETTLHHPEPRSHAAKRG